MLGQVRTLPTDEDESRVLNSFWMSSNLDPIDVMRLDNGDGPPLHCNASLLVHHATKPNVAHHAHLPRLSQATHDTLSGKPVH